MNLKQGLAENYADSIGTVFKKYLQGDPHNRRLLEQMIVVSDSELKELASTDSPYRNETVKNFLAKKKSLVVRRQYLDSTLRLINDAFVDDGPLFRSISPRCMDGYLTCGEMTPQAGHFYMVGNDGIFFSNSFATVMNYHSDGDGLIVVTTRRILDPEGRAVDTTKPEYDVPFVERFPNLTSYDLWRKITKNDTITLDSNGSHTFTKRETVTRSKIVAELFILL